MTGKTPAPMTPQKAAALAKAQAAAKEQLERGSPRQRGVERTEEALEWVYKWGWSTPTVLEIQAGTFRSGLAARLVKNGFLNRIQAPSGGINSTPSFLLTLTEKGFEEAVRITDKLLQYETDPHRINLKNVTHDEIVQRVTALRLWGDGGAQIGEYLTPKSLAHWNQNQIKIPDVIWKIDQNGETKTIAVELELTPKFAVEFDRFIDMVAGLVDGRNLNADKKPIFDGVEIYSKSPALIRKYKASLFEGSRTPVWQKEPGKTGRWKKVLDKNGDPIYITITKQASEKINFTLLTPEMLEVPKGRFC